MTLNFIRTMTPFLWYLGLQSGLLGTVTIVVALAGFVFGVEVVRPRNHLGAGRATEDSSNGGVPAALFASAVTSLAQAYRDDIEGFQAHLLDEQESLAAVRPTARSPFLCCSEYKYGAVVKEALGVASDGRSRTAMNHCKSGEESLCCLFEVTRLCMKQNSHILYRVRYSHSMITSSSCTPVASARGYCSVAHLSADTALSASEKVHVSVRCTPMTHAAKESQSLLEIWSDGDETFGVKLGCSLQVGARRAVIVTMSPGSLSWSEPVRSVRGGDSRLGLRDLERRWRTMWSRARGTNGLDELREIIPWTRRHGDRVPTPEGEKWSVNYAPASHQAKSSAYISALKHVEDILRSGAARDGHLGGEDRSLDEECSWDRVSFEHPRDDVLYLRGLHNEDHDQTTAKACFMVLIGFLSGQVMISIGEGMSRPEEQSRNRDNESIGLIHPLASPVALDVNIPLPHCTQPEVLHIQPEARVMPQNKVATAYTEGGDIMDTPMRIAGLDGSGEVVGVVDSGLDDKSCFFSDPANGPIVRSTLASPFTDEAQRKVIQYVVVGEGHWDESGHGTHVSGTVAGSPYLGWEEDWSAKQSVCVAPGIASCFGDCVTELLGKDCYWNPEKACPAYGCDASQSCDDGAQFDFPCFDDAEAEISDAAGMAPAAKIAFVDIGDKDGLILSSSLGRIFSAQRKAGARIHTNSWSLSNMNEPSDLDVEIDEFVHSNPDSVVIFGVGNTGEDGTGSANSPSTSKTTIAVGALNSGPGRLYAYHSTANANYVGISPDKQSFDVCDFSSQGPVGGSSFFVKPDVVAPGIFVHSAKAAENQVEGATCALASSGGTSMSAPVVAGSAALIRQYFRKGFFANFLEGEGLCEADGAVHAVAGLCEGFVPSGALIKAMLVNSSKWLGTLVSLGYGDTAREDMTNMDFMQGFGAVQLASSTPTVTRPFPGLFVHEGSVDSNSSTYYSFKVTDTSTDLVVTLAWYDPPSSIVAYNLLHDLDLTVTSVTSGTIFWSNAHDTLELLCGVDPECPASFGLPLDLSDDVNTVERVMVDSSDLSPGFYVAEVRAKRLTESTSQAFGIAAAGDVVLHDLGTSLETLSTEGGSDKVNKTTTESSTPAPTILSISTVTTQVPHGSDDSVPTEAPGNASPTLSPSTGLSDTVGEEERWGDNTSPYIAMAAGSAAALAGFAMMGCCIFFVRRKRQRGDDSDEDHSSSDDISHTSPW